MHTYLVMFDCLVVAEPFFLHIQADNLDECWHKAYKISVERRELSDGNFEIYRLTTQADYEAEPNFYCEEVN